MPSAAWKASAAPWKAVIMLAGMADVGFGLPDRVDRLAERGARRQVERHRRRRKLAEMVDSSGAVCSLTWAIADSGTWPLVAVEDGR